MTIAELANLLGRTEGLPSLPKDPHASLFRALSNAGGPIQPFRQCRHPIHPPVVLWTYPFKVSLIPTAGNTA